MRSDAIPNFSNLGPQDVRPGAMPERACTIFAHLLADRLDEFLIQNLYASAARQCFDHGRLFVFHRNGREHHQSIVKMNSDIIYNWRGQGNSSIPMDFFDNTLNAALRAGDDTWYTQGCAKLDLMLVPSMMNWRHLGAFERPPRLSVPRHLVPQISEALRALDVDPNWWFCAIAVPESDAGADLDAFNASLIALTELVVGQFGAGLVLVGDPETALGALPSNVSDARRLPESVIGQGFVISKARFLMELTPSPWLWLAFGLDVPWLRRVKAATPSKLPGRGFIYPSGPGDTNAAMAAARAMIRETQDCPMWRAGRAHDPVPAPNAMHLPMHDGPNAQFIVL
ncbi:MAG: hypothetical protein OSB69_17470 [Alphaproteobacteria bacterium]|nr:hypothetical protein [Alphaproteobacteria bacterium]